MTRVRENICDAISLMSRQRLTNEVLGYPPDARLLIINCDDFGMCFSQNMGTIQSIETGIASSCSLMMPPAWGMHAAQFLHEHSEVDFAVHLTALSEYKYYRWGPLMPVDEVPTLVNEDGYFLSDDEFDEILRRAECSELIGLQNGLPMELPKNNSPQQNIILYSLLINTFKPIVLIVQ